MDESTGGTVRFEPSPKRVRAYLAGGLACFYDEKADVYLDGELQERPRTQFG
ncbi:MAG TPA: hypothetical protein VF060_06545 [Trebonia sp.]